MVPIQQIQKHFALQNNGGYIGTYIATKKVEVYHQPPVSISLSCCGVGE